jgi:hypothetical protein
MSNKILLVIVHSNSFGKIRDEGVADAFLKCSNLGEILILATPTADNPSWLGNHPQIFRIAYEDRSNGSFVARYKIPNHEVRILVHDYLPKEMITELYGYREDSAEFTEARGAFTDLLTSEALSRDENDAIFVTESHHLLEKNVWIQKRFEVKILSFSEALEYIDLRLRRYDQTSYYAAPRYKIKGGNAFHYWFLLKDLVPKFSEAWGISVFGTNRIQNGKKIQNALQGFASKFENALYSSDLIAMEYMKRPNNLTEWEMLYNLNYFCMLVTGIFDMLAWLSTYRFSIPIHQPYEVSIHITGHKSKGARFVGAIARSNPSLASFIVTKQNFIHLFYPLRDATQHREPVGGALFEETNEGWTVSVANLEQDAVDALKMIDQNGYPFTKFGLLNAGTLNHMEPHRFTRQALRELTSICNTYLEMLDFPLLIATSKDLVDKITHAKQQNDVPFIARTYWKRDCHLPILFRNR